MEKIRDVEAPPATIGGREGTADSQTRKGQRTLVGLSRELLVEELAQSGTQKMLVDRVDQLAEEVEELEAYRKRYYAANEEIAVLKVRVEELRHRTASEEVLSGTTLAVGAALIGYSPSLTGATMWAAVAFGVALVLAGICVKALSGFRKEDGR